VVRSRSNPAVIGQKLSKHSGTRQEFRSFMFADTQNANDDSFGAKTGFRRVRQYRKLVRFWSAVGTTGQKGPVGVLSFPAFGGILSHYSHRFVTLVGIA
jgi:hypothetical protein